MVVNLGVWSTSMQFEAETGNESSIWVEVTRFLASRTPKKAYE